MVRKAEIKVVEGLRGRKFRVADVKIIWYNKCSDAVLKQSIGHE